MSNMAMVTSNGDPGNGNGNGNGDIWDRRNKQRKKLSRFFGEEAPVDVSVQEIQKYGLTALLKSNVPLTYFLYMLMEKYCSENLFFYLEAEDFSKHEFEKVEDQRRTAVNIYKYFIKENADFEVNLEAKVTRPIKKAIEEDRKDCFDVAKESTVHILEPMFLEFATSPLWKQMVADIGENNYVYSKEARDKAVHQLIKFFDKSLPSEESGIRSHDRAIAAERGRARLIRNLAHAFCKTRLRCDFYDKENQENLPKISRDILTTGGARPF